ncbi:acyltransferase family protein [Pedobacter metabolipauper]|uniref:Putative acyltransferase n=1 Tax=Pedobacter metabolipauper TaxID=425513 RepID=A0A4R6SYF5_9SPHI|nr:heparan-alpha-glucosaminide N-acetyltransferase domain-containing protein [Pedobacter metabolipauper]TDQ09742.1 putative acyltransferase [Pedobacter metabolipauper]
MTKSQTVNPNSARLLSLDFFRGATVAAMILVNNPGSWGHIYAPLEHAEWNGCTPTDLVFPFFLFIVGVSIAYAMGSKKEDPAIHSKIILKAFKRALILFGLGLFLSLFPKVFTDPVDAFQHVRIPGVLQRIAVVFFIASILFLKNSEKNIFRILILILAVYWALMTFVPVPGTGYANLEKETNLGAWLDRSLLTEAHLWKSAKTWDPEGILSTLPAIATGLFGVLVGAYLRRKDRDAATKVTWLFCAGTAAIFLGLLWDLQFPINKALWTSSYVLYTGGLATMILALCYWIIDVQQYNKFTRPFVVYGVNAITVFFLSGLIPRILNMIKLNRADGSEISLQTWLYAPYTEYFSPINASLAWAISFVLFWLIILWIMYNRKIIIKV